MTASRQVHPWSGSPGIKIALLVQTVLLIKKRNMNSVNVHIISGEDESKQETIPLEKKREVNR
jgi:hypothetical protein